MRCHQNHYHRILLSLQSGLILVWIPLQDPLLLWIFLQPILTRSSSIHHHLTCAPSRMVCSINCIYLPVSNVYWCMVYNFIKLLTLAWLLILAWQCHVSEVEPMRVRNMPSGEHAKKKDPIRDHSSYHCFYSKGIHVEWTTPDLERSFSLPNWWNVYGVQEEIQVRKNCNCRTVNWNRHLAEQVYGRHG